MHQRLKRYLHSFALALLLPAAATAQNFGIGDANPTAKLHVQANGTASANAAALVEDASNIQLFRVNENGNVFLSTLAGAVPTSTATDFLVIEASGRIGKVTGGGGVSGSGTATQVAFWAGTVGSASTTLTSSANLFWDNANNRLGVGVPAPTQALQVAGAIQFSGALMPAGNAGTNGQILLSSGPGLAPVWSSFTNKVDLISLASGGAGITEQAPPGGTNIAYIALPNLIQNITVPAGQTYKVLVTAMGSCSKGATTGTRIYAQYEIFLDNVGTGAFQRVGIDDETVAGTWFDEEPWSISSVLTLGPGTHTIGIGGAHAGGDTTGANASVWLCAPAGNVGQATMNLVIVKD